MMISGSISERVFLILPTAVVPPFDFIVSQKLIYHKEGYSGEQNQESKDFW